MEVYLQLSIKPFTSLLDSVTDEDFVRIKSYVDGNCHVITELVQSRIEEQRLEAFRRSPAGFLDGVLSRLRGEDWTITKKWLSSSGSNYFELERDDVTKSLRYSDHTTSVFDGIDVSIVVSATRVSKWDSEPDCQPRVKIVTIFTSMTESRQFFASQLTLAQEHVVEALNLE